MRLVAAFILLCALALGLGLSAPVLAQEEQDDGAGFLERQIQNALSSAGREVTVRGFEGALSSRATLERMTISDDDGVWLTLENAVLDWNRSALLRGRLEVEELSAERLIVARPPLPNTDMNLPDPEAKPFSLPDLPVSVDIGKLAIDSVELGEGLFGQPAVVSLDGSASLADGSGAADLQVSRIDDARGEISLDASYDAASSELAIDLTLDEGPDGIAAALLNIPDRPAVVASVQGSGPLSDFTARIDVDTDGEDRLSGTVEISSDGEGDAQNRNFAVDLGGDLAPVLAPQYRPFFGPDIQLSAQGQTLADGRIAVNDLSFSARAMTLRGSLSLGADRLPREIALRGEIADPAGGRVVLPFGGGQTQVDRVGLDVAFDAAEGEDWTGEITVEGMTRPGMAIETLRLNGTGRIATEGTQAVSAALDFAAEGLALDDAGMQQALGDQVAGAARIDWTQGQPVQLGSLTLNGASFALDGSGQVDTTGATPTASLQATLDADSLARFSGLAGRDLEGAAQVTLDADIGLGDASFDIAVDGETTDLAVGIPQADALISGRTALTLRAARDTEGTRIEELRLGNERIALTGSADLRTENSTARAQISLPDTSVVDPDLTGPLDVTFTADQTGTAWAFALNGAGLAADLTGDGSLDTGGDVPRVTLDATLEARALEQFAKLTGLPLGGAINADVTAEAVTDGSLFSLDLTGATRDLAVGVAQVDRLLEGSTSVAVQAARQGANAPVTLSQLNVQNPQLSLTGQGQFALGGSNGQASLKLTDLGNVIDGMEGALDATVTASEVAGGWQLVIDADAPDATLDADATITEVAGGNPLIEGTATLSAQDIARFEALAGRRLGGAVDLRVTGRARADMGMFDVAVNGTTRSLVLGIDQADGLLQGETRIDAQASRASAEDPIEIGTLSVENPQLTLNGQGRYGAGQSDLSAALSIADLADVQDGLTGSAEAQVTAREIAEGWAVSVDADAAGTTLDASAEITDLASGAPLIDGTARLDAPALSRFEALAGRPLDGAVDLRIEGRARTDTSTFDVTVDGTSDSLVLGIDTLDGLLRGETDLGITASRDAADGAIEVPRLQLRNPQITVDGSGTYGPDPDDTAQARITIADLSQVDPDLRGSAEIAFDATEGEDGWQVALDAQAADATLAANALVSEIASGAPLIDGSANLRADDLSRFAPLAGRPLAGAVALDIEGAAKTDLSRFDLTVDGTAETVKLGIDQLDNLLAGTTELGVTARRDPEAGVIELPRLRLVNPQISVLGEGAYGPGQNTVTADIEVPDLSAIDPALSGDATATLRASEGDDGWTIDLDAEAAGATATAQALVSDLAGGTPLVEGSARVQAPDLSRLAPLARRQLDGSLDLRIEGSARADASRFDLTADGTAQSVVLGIPQADALLAGATTLGVTARREPQSGRIEVPRLSLRNPQVTVEGQGTYGAGENAITADIAMPDLGVLDPALSGQATATLRATEGARGWDVDLDADAAGAQLAAQALVSEIESGTPLVEGTATLEAAELSRFSGLAGRPLGGALSAEVAGSARADASSFDVTVDATTRGLRVGQAEADRLLAGTTQVALSASRDGAEAPITVERFTLDGAALDASASGTLGGGRSSLTLDARLADIAPYAAGISGPVSVTGTVGEAGGNAYALDLDATGPGGTRVSAGGTVQADFGQVNLDVQGTAPLGLANRFIQPRSVVGTVNFDLAVNGPPALSSVSGRISTGSGARLVDPALGIVLNDLSITVDLSGNTARLTGTASKQEGGVLRIEGPIGLTGGYDADLRIVLNGLVVEDPALYRTTLNGGLAVTGPLAGGARIAGTVTLGETELRIPSTGLGATGPIPDGLEHVNEPADVRATRRRAGLIEEAGDRSTGTGTRVAYPLDVTIDAPNRIFIRGRGLDAEVGGSLTIGGTTANPIPAGEFDLIRGRLDILGQRLELVEASVTLQGDFQPLIRLVAQTRAGDDTTVQIVVSGTASDPEIRFESSPELPEEEVLSRLLFGRALGSISPLQAAQLASAVATLAGRGGDGVVGKLREGFGLDDLDITTTDDGNAAVRAGAYLSENIYSDVTVDSEGTAEINLNLDLSESVTVTGSAKNDGETSLGVFFERDY